MGYEHCGLLQWILAASYDVETHLDYSWMKPEAKMSYEPLQCSMMLHDTVLIFCESLMMPLWSLTSQHRKEISNMFENFQQHPKSPQCTMNHKMWSMNEVKVDQDVSQCQVCSSSAQSSGRWERDICKGITDDHRSGLYHGTSLQLIDYLGLLLHPKTVKMCPDDPWWSRTETYSFPRVLADYRLSRRCWPTGFGI